MTDDRLTSPSGKPTFIKKTGQFLLIIPSAIIGIFLVELFCNLFVPSIANTKDLFKWNRPFLFINGRGSIFQNHGDIYTYVPHNEIRYLLGYISDDDFHIEYDYHLHTNNFGLVQDADIMPERESLLVLGDSFTEGQGAEPWFRLVSPEIDKLGYQPVNGGLMGTGFEQWLKLDRYLAAENVRIRKLVVVFISSDYVRPMWNVPPGVFSCLAAPLGCNPDDSPFFWLPSPEELTSFIGKIRMTRAPLTKFWFKAHIQALLPASYRIYNNFKSIGRSHRAEQQSRFAIAELIRLYGAENVAFIHLPQKDEIDGPTEVGLTARHSIEEAGAKLFDGFKLCQLTPKDYYSNDGHPNRDGYAKIAFCVTNVIKSVIADSRG
jgi:hypothetical protein